MTNENRDAFIAHLMNLEDEGKNDAFQQKNIHNLYLSDTVGTDHGRAQVQEDWSEDGVFHFKITLGPANARKLVDFLQTLPDEPGYGDEDA